MLADVEHFRTKLSKIEGANVVSDQLLEVVQAKVIMDEAEKPEPASEKQEPDEGSDSTKS